ncbi:hypothetical protein ABMA58_07835 [Oceanospirillum sp. HFRX-1_2]
MLEFFKAYNVIITPFITVLAAIAGVSFGSRLSLKAEQRRLLNSTYFHLYSIWRVLLVMRATRSEDFKPFDIQKVFGWFQEWVESKGHQLSESEKLLVPQLIQGLVDSMIPKLLTTSRSLSDETLLKLDNAVEDFAKIAPASAHQLRHELSHMIYLVRDGIPEGLPEEFSQLVDQGIVNQVVSTETLEEITEALESSIRELILKKHGFLFGWYRARKLPAVREYYMDLSMAEKDQDKLIKQRLLTLLDQFESKIFIEGSSESHT